MRKSTDILQLAAKSDTPFYFYDIALLQQTVDAIQQEAKRYEYHVHYALKANTNTELLKIIRGSGMGADCVSGNEIKCAIENGFPPSEIVFAGVGKSDPEINYALENNIFCFNCESLQELAVINELAAAKRKTAQVALRINPNVNANTHKYITTGLDENKFGISLSQLPETVEFVLQCANLKLTGLHFHIGSQITDMTSFRNLCNRINEIQQWFIARNIFVPVINVGGGLGVDYYYPDENPMPDFVTYFGLFHQFLELQQGQQVHFELGRAVVAQCGTLVSKVLYIKNGVSTSFVIVDAGMTELIRPALYQSYHKIENISKATCPQDAVYDVVGPICESSDFFGKRVSLPETSRGDIIIIRTAGAYGEVMSSQYNLREKVKSYFK